MSKDIRIKKGLDIKIKGGAEAVLKEAPASEVYALIPDDFHGIIPKIQVKEGDSVKTGSPIFYDKNSPEVVFVSPVSGVVKEVVRGEKRKILEIQVSSDGKEESIDFGAKNPKELSRKEIIDFICEGGCWPFIKRRPYDVVAKVDEVPKSIFISAYESAPLAPDYEFALKDKKEAIKTGVEVLKKLTEGKVHITVDGDYVSNSIFNGIEGAELHGAYGPHPVGNVSTQISKIDPINKGEVIWVVSPNGLAIIGDLFNTGKYNPSRIIALTGSQVETPIYVEAKIGAQIKDILSLGGINGNNNRIINGNVLTGPKVQENGFLSAVASQITVIPEGNEIDFLGWQFPRPNKPSFYRIDFFNWLAKKFSSKEYTPNTNTNGEHRAYVLTGNFEKVFPLDIYPLQLLKACMVGDIDNMEELGIYEVAPEDFALTEFIDVSKHNQQDLIRKSLDLMIKEVG